MAAFVDDCRQTGQAFRRAAAQLLALDHFARFGYCQTGQAFHSPAGERPTFLLAEKRGPKMRPWRVGRAKKPHDYASWLRGSLTALPCADSELSRIHSGHPEGLLSANSPPRNGMKVKCTQRSALRNAAASRWLRFLSTHRPFLSASAGRKSRLRDARGRRVFGRGTGCAFDRTRPALAKSGGFIARPTGHRDASFGFFSLREKSDSLAGRRDKRCTNLASGNQREAAGGRREKRLGSLATANKRSGANINEAMKKSARPQPGRTPAAQAPTRSRTQSRIPNRWATRPDHCRTSSPGTPTPGRCCQGARRQLR